MNYVVNFLLGFVALQHFGFLVLEMFLWTKPIGLKVFRMTPEIAQKTATLAANQGLYNGFLAAGLVWGLCSGETQIQLFFLSCVLIAGIYGAWTVGKSILWIQAMPAGLTLLLLWLSVRA